MKKIIGISSALLIFLAACANGTTTKVSDPETVVGTVDGKDGVHEVTSNDLYDKMIEDGNNGLTTFYEIIDEFLLNEYYPEDSEDIKTAYDKRYTDIENYYASQDVPQTMEELATAQNLTMDELQETIMNVVQQEAMIEDYAADQITEEEIKAEFDARGIEYRASIINIEIATTDENGNEIAEAEALALAQTKAEEALQALKDGEEFSTVAQNYSSLDSASKGGDMGYFYSNEQEEVIISTLESLKIDENSEIVRTSYGLSIIKKTAEEEKVYDDEKEAIAKSLADKKIENDSTIATEATEAFRKTNNVTVLDERLIEQKAKEDEDKAAAEEETTV